jgi:acyl carrier protein
MTNSKKLYQIISNVMDMPLSEISDSLGPNNIENWDSFNALLLVDELETEFKIQFSLEEMDDVESIFDIKRHLRNHGVSFDE